jgi:hypothetical protein
MTPQPEFDFYAPEVMIPPAPPAKKQSLAPAIRKRQRKKVAVEQFFTANLGISFSTYELHAKFGTAFRTRASEINRDPSSMITIKNKRWFDEASQAELSSYCAELRAQ